MKRELFNHGTVQIQMLEGGRPSLSSRDKWVPAWRARVLFFNGERLVLIDAEGGISSLRALGDGQFSWSSLHYLAKWLDAERAKRGHRGDRWGRAWLPTSWNMRVSPRSLARLQKALASLQ